MILFSIGLPSRFAEWCDALIGRLAKQYWGSVEALPLEGVDDLAPAIIRTSVPVLVARCRQPVPRLQTELLQADRPFLIAFSDPCATLRDLVDQGHPLVEATRWIASGCAAISRLATAPGALVMSQSDATDAAAVARAVADHFGLAIGDDEILQAVSDPAVAEIPAGVSEGDWRAGLEERERAVIEGALAPYIAPISNGTDPKPLIWERELFFLFEDPPAAHQVVADRPVDLTGRARVVIYGPGINLSPGTWSANVALGLSPETVGMSFLVEVYAGRQLSSSRITSPGAQVLDIALPFVVDTVLDRPIEIRILSERAAFEGRLALGQVTLTPQQKAGSEVRSYLSQVVRKR